MWDPVNGSHGYSPGQYLPSSQPLAPGPGNMFPGLCGAEAMKKWKIDRIISVATLVTSLMALFLVLKKPAPVAQPQPAAAAVANAVYDAIGARVNHLPLTPERVYWALKTLKMNE